MDVNDTGRAAGEDSAGRPSGGGDSLRDKVRAYLETRMSEGGGHAVISTRSIAETFGVTAATVSHHLRTLAQQGVIHTRSAGRKGLIISVPEPGRRAGRGRAVRVGRALPTAVKAAGRAQGGPFCPWCGNKVRKEWRYCNNCGEKL